jgi:hypothetical protein
MSELTLRSVPLLHDTMTAAFLADVDSLVGRKRMHLNI